MTQWERCQAPITVERAGAALQRREHFIIMHRAALTRHAPPLNWNVRRLNVVPPCHG
jgi:hypothetical protein